MTKLKFKNILKILLSNWAHLISIYLGFYTTIIFSKIIGQSNFPWSSILFESLWTIPLLIFIYGLELLAKFYVTIFVLDFLLFAFDNRWTKQKLLIEWFVISVPFINAAFEYKYWAWLTISALFLLTQLYRSKIILRVINDNKTATNSGFGENAGLT
jgi:hypothetical protein